MSCQSHQISPGPHNLNRIKYSKSHPCNTCVLSLEGSFDDALIRIQELEVELLIKCLRYFALKKNGCPWPFLDYIYIHLPTKLGFLMYLVINTSLAIAPSCPPCLTLKLAWASTLQRILGCINALTKLFYGGICNMTGFLWYLM